MGSAGQQGNRQNVLIPNIQEHGMTVVYSILVMFLLSQYMSFDANSDNISIIAHYINYNVYRSYIGVTHSQYYLTLVLMAPVPYLCYYFARKICTKIT